MYSINTRVVQVSAVKYFLMDLILIKFSIALFVVFFCFICSLKHRVWSKYPHRYLTTLCKLTRLPLALSGVLVDFCRCCPDPNLMYSVLSELSFRWLVSIQYFMFVTVVSSSSLVLMSWFLLDALYFFLIEWLSTNPFMMLSGITSVINVQ